MDILLSVQCIITKLCAHLPLGLSHRLAWIEFRLFVCVSVIWFIPNVYCYICSLAKLYPLFFFHKSHLFCSICILSSVMNRLFIIDHPSIIIWTLKLSFWHIYQLQLDIEVYSPSPLHIPNTLPTWLTLMQIHRVSHWLNMTEVKITHLDMIQLNMIQLKRTKPKWT